MKIIPNEEFCFKTNMSQKEVEKEINDIIINIQFQGKKQIELNNCFIQNNEFEIKQNLNTYNSISLNIKGKIITENNKTIVNMKMKLDKYIIGLYIFLLSITSLFFIAGIYFTLTDKYNIILIIESILRIIIITFAVLFFGWFLINSVFENRKNIAKEYFIKVFKAI